MDIKAERLFPHPVLYEGNDDYNTASFGFNLTAESKYGNMTFTGTFDLRCPKIEALIRSREAEYVMHIECSRTCYRTVVRSFDSLCVYDVPESKLNGKVEICAFVVARDDIENYESDDFNVDYRGVAFSVAKGGILAMAPRVDVTVTKDADRLDKLPSIFSIVRQENATELIADLSGDKIMIAMPPKLYEKYCNFSSVAVMQPILNAMIILPSLVYALEYVQTADSDDDLESRRWYIGLARAANKMNFELKEELEQKCSYELAQKLLGGIYNYAIDCIEYICSGDDE